MVDLKQKELADWQQRNFPKERYMEMSKEELIDMIFKLQCALGMAEEVGEICHHVLKGSQGIRGGVNGTDVVEVADGVVDSNIYGTQLLSAFNVDAEQEHEKVIHNVLVRDWNKNPSGEGA